MKRKKTDNISYIAPDGKKFRDLKEYMDYAATKFHDGKVVPGSVAQLFMSLRRYQDTDYVHAIVSIKDEKDNFSVQCFHTMPVDNIEFKSSQTFMMVNSYILKSDTEKGSKHAPLKLPTTN